MKTYRRDKLRRLVEAGRVVMAGAYSFDDMLGESRTEGVALPVAMKTSPDWRERVEGICYLDSFHFTTKSGACWENPNGTVTLIVHSNSNYDFRILPPGETWMTPEWQSKIEAAKEYAARMTRPIGA